MLGEMWMNVPPFGLGMNKTMSDDIAWQCKHYADVERSRSRVWCSIDPGYGSACLEDGGVNRSSLSASLKTAQNPNGEPFPANHSGNS